MWATIRKWLLVILILGAGGFLLFKWIQFRQAWELLPVGTTVAGLDVSGLTFDQANELLSKSYYAPVYIYHRDEHVELDPQNVGFSLNTEAMLGEVRQALASRDSWIQFAAYVLNRPLQAIAVPLVATHDEGGLEAVIQSIADFLDEPAQQAQMLSRGEALQEGQVGYVTDIEASIPLTQEALYRPNDRVVELLIVEEDAPEVNLDLLSDAISQKLQNFDGLGSIFIMDLETGEEMGINADVAMSGLSILKIAIFVEAYRALAGEPNPEEQQLFLDTATKSSNYGANLLLHIVAGEDNTYKGADILTESMRELGLVNTFMAVPYDASPPAYRQTTYVTPANSRPDLETVPDPTMQSTAEEIGTLLAMIYYCSQGGGTLLAAYPGEITPQECQSIIDLMVLNEEGNLIRYGVPEDTPVSHKHGWARATHADAGIVFSAGGDFVIVEYLDQPGDWLLADQSFPILREIARMAYNFFNMDDPYQGDAIQDSALLDPSNPFSEYRDEVLEPEVGSPEIIDSDEGGVGSETPPANTNDSEQTSEG